MHPRISVEGSRIPAKSGGHQKASSENGRQHAHFLLSGRGDLRFELEKDQM